MSVFDRLSISRAIATIAATVDPDDPRTVEASERIRQIGHVAIPRLIEALSGGRRQQTVVMQNLLTKLLDDQSLPAVRQGLSHAKPEVAERVAEVLSRPGRYDPNLLLPLFLDPESPKNAIAEILIARAKTVDGLAVERLLDDVVPETRLALLRVLHHIADRRLEPKLLARLESSEAGERQALLRTLGRFTADDDVRDAMIKAMLEEPNKAARMAALESLLQADEPPPLEPLFQVLRDDDMIIQGKALEALIRLHRPETTRHAVALLRDEDEGVRRSAVEILNQLPNPAAIAPLGATLDDPDWWFRERAADALVAIGGPGVVDALVPRFEEQSEELDQTVISVITRLEDEPFERLDKLLDTETDAIRSGVLRTLAALDDERVVTSLLTRLASSSPGWAAEIADALGAFGDPSAIRPLLTEFEQADDEDYQQRILRALEKVTDHENAAFVVESVRRIGQRGSQNLRSSASQTVHSLHLRFDHLMSPAPDSPATPISAVAPPASAVATASAEFQDQSQSTLIPAIQTAANQLQNLPGDPPPTTESSPASQTRDTQIDLAAPARLGVEINPLALRPGDRLGDRYRVIRQIGRGGFGVVVLVEDEIINERLILKFLAPNVAEDETVVHRFKHEIRYARRITHENVIRLHDLISIDGTLAISMEYFASNSLVAELKQHQRLPQQRGRTIISAICSGLSAAHKEGVIHRDLKPGNILIDDALNVKIVDFGLAAAASQGASRLTRSGLVIGTPIYMAPEQIEGYAIDGRTDIYSLGVLMYEMFTGSVPYEGENAMATLFQHLHGTLEAPSKRCSAISDALEGIILKSMARRPENRYADTFALREALAELPDDLLE